jgi:hypothetical protein
LGAFSCRVSKKGKKRPIKIVLKDFNRGKEKKREFYVDLIPVEEVANEVI